MEWIKTVLEKHIAEDGKLDLAKAMEEVKTQFPINAVPKEVFNQKLEDLKSANKLVEDLKKDNSDVEKLQGKISEYEKNIETLKTERTQERKMYTLKEKLKDAGAKDIDYMIYKMGEVELDEDGNVKELDNKITDLKKSYGDMFTVEETKETPQTNDKGFKVMDTGLDNGKAPDAMTQVKNEFEQAMGLK